MGSQGLFPNMVRKALAQVVLSNGYCRSNKVKDGFNIKVSEYIMHLTILHNMNCEPMTEPQSSKIWKWGHWRTRSDVIKLFLYITWIYGDVWVTDLWKTLHYGDLMCLLGYIGFYDVKVNCTYTACLQILTKDLLQTLSLNLCLGQQTWGKFSIVCPQLRICGQTSLINRCSTFLTYRIWC